MLDPKDYAFTLTPSLAIVGDTLTLNFTGAASEAKAVTVKINEVADPTDINPSETPETLYRFVGEIKNKAFVLASPQPAPTPPPAGTPIIKVAVAGKTFDVPLLGLNEENGIGELRLEVTAQETIGSTTIISSAFDGKAVVRVRSFITNRARGRAVVSFVTGTGGFYDYAYRYFRMPTNADAVIRLSSLEDIVFWLKSQASAYGPWGEINIVSHGNPYAIMMPLLNSDLNSGDDERFRKKTTITRLRHAFEPTAIPEREIADDIPVGVSQPFPSAVEMGIDATTKVVFRACNIGKNTGLLNLLRKHVFGNICNVYAPKHIQTYSGSVKDSNGPCTEFFQESLSFTSPTATPLTAAQADAKLKDLFETKYPGVEWSKERSTFTKHGSDSDSIKPTQYKWEHSLYSDWDDAAGSSPDGKKFTADELQQAAKDYFDAQGQTGKDRSESEGSADWAWNKPTPTRETPDEDPSMLWVEPPETAKAKPRIQGLSVGGTMTVGNTSGDATIKIDGPKIVESHVEIHVDQADRVQIGVTISPTDGNTVQIKVGKSRLPVTGPNTGNATTPFSLVVDTVSIPFRPIQYFKLDFVQSQQKRDYRRDLKLFDPAVAYANRRPVAMNLDDQSLYGMSPRDK